MNQLASWLKSLRPPEWLEPALPYLQLVLLVASVLLILADRLRRL